ncbi:glyoxalase [Chimaeribacter arupi]|uniref:glyoxalase n=1 Tax=Chimaeribacter arupi TaxID=2060066 RepID=UPI002945FBC1|nr:glyoxalase [Chimaeribacter arupi]MDV5140387.1 glyoxalase [Chimaeribacter arupi]
MNKTRFGVLALALSLSACPAAWAAQSLAVGAQYDTTHVYVQPGKMDDFVNSLLHTFGGKATQRITADVTPTPSETLSQLVLTPVGSFSVFDFQTSTPYPFGDERNGFLVRDMDAAVAQAKAAGADVLVEPFPDPIGRDAVIQWPGGVNMQLYWHTKAPDYAPLSSVPENRVYLSRYRVEDFIRSYQQFSQGKVDRDQQVSAALIGETQGTVREVDLSSTFGKVKIFVTDGHLPYPFGHERTGYGVTDLQQTLDKALASHAKILWRSADTTAPAAMVEFPGGYIAEIHQVKA